VLYAALDWLCSQQGRIDSGEVELSQRAKRLSMLSRSKNTFLWHGDRELGWHARRPSAKSSPCPSVHEGNCSTGDYDTPTPNTRRAVHADIERIMAIRHGVRENRLLDPNSVTAADCVDFIARAEMWVWIEDGQVQGFSAGDPCDGTIWALFVDPAFEGRCIGRTLLGLACGTVRDAGHEKARLNTEAGTRAERFYRTNGWIAVGRSSKGEIIFEKALTELSE
jgi:GNAT superfamily N-acetyltransferase